MSLWRKFREARRPQPMSVEEYFVHLREKGLNPDGTAILDATPLAPPVGYKKHPSMVEIVRDMVRSEKLRVAALEAGKETFEESEDFEIEEDPVMPSPWVNEFDPPVQELVKAGREALEAKKKKLGGAGAPAPAKGARRAPEAPGEEP